MNAHEKHRKHRIVVVGAGYAGLTATQRLARRLRADEVEVTLVTAAPEFIERPRMHQLATGQDISRLPFDALVGRTVELKIASVQAVDLAAKQVVLDDTEVLPYDTLVLGVGSRIETTRVPGVAQHAVALNDREIAEDTARRLGRLAEDGGRAVVCGGGLTGVEIAAELAERWPNLDVRLVSTREPAPWFSPRARAYLDATLDLLGITRTYGRIQRVEEGSLDLGEEKVAFDLCLWAGGFEPSPLVAASGLAVDGSGRAIVDRTMRSRSHPDVWVVGDAAAVPGPWGDALAMGCRTGSFTGPAAAEAIVADLTDQPARPLRFRYVHECLSLGRRHGVIQFLDATGQPKDRILTDRLAIAYKNVTLDGGRFLFRHPGMAAVPRRRRRIAGSLRARAASATIAS